MFESSWIDWTQLYVNLFREASPDVIVQTLNRILITAKKKNDKTVADMARLYLNRIFKDIFAYSLKFDTIERYSVSNRKFDPKIIKPTTTSTTNNTTKSEKTDTTANDEYFIHSNRGKNIGNRLNN